jgi:VanZ family protein
MATKVAWTPLFWCCAAAILILALIPGGTPLPSTGWDKSNHLLAFSVLTFLGRLAFQKQGWRILLFMISYGILIELLQALTPTRFAEPADVFADALGAVAGYFMANLYVRLGRQIVREPNS